METSYEFYVSGKADALLKKRFVAATVTQGLFAPWTFTARFVLDTVDGENAIELLDGSALVPESADTPFSILVWHDGEATCLLHGIITSARAELRHGGVGSVLEIEGRDRSALIDRYRVTFEKTGKLSDIAKELVQRHFPEPFISATTVHHDDKHPLRSTGQTALAFLQTAGAKENRFLWIEPRVEVSPDPTKTVTLSDSLRFAELRTPEYEPDVASSFRINAGAKTNVSSVQLQVGGVSPMLDPLRYFMVDDKGTIIEHGVEWPEREKLLKKLGDEYANFELFEVPATHAALDALRTSVLKAAAEDAKWNVFVELQTTADLFYTGMKSPHVVFPHQVVGVEGVGKQSGRYIVRNVTHTLARSGHKMAVSLQRTRAIEA